LTPIGFRLLPVLRSGLLGDDDPTTYLLNQLLRTRTDVAEQVLVAENGEPALRTPSQTGSALASPA
jgi:hypothetical protein